MLSWRLRNTHNLKIRSDRNVSPLRISVFRCYHLSSRILAFFFISSVKYSHVSLSIFSGHDLETIHGENARSLAVAPENTVIGMQAFFCPSLQAVNFHCMCAVYILEVRGSGEQAHSAKGPDGGSRQPKSNPSPACLLCGVGSLNLAQWWFPPSHLHIYWWLRRSEMLCLQSSRPGRSPA